MSPLLLLLLGLLSLLLCVLRGRRRRDNEPPLIKGWIPYVGKALEFGRGAGAFLEEQKKKYGDIFTVHIAGKYMTFIMDPFMYPSIIKHGRQLDFHKFSEKMAPVIFAYPPIRGGRSPGLHDEVIRSFKLLHGDDLAALTESMMGNLLLVLREDHMGSSGWRSSGLYDLCSRVMFEATFLTIYGRPAAARRHGGMNALREDFRRFDAMFPLLVAMVPIWLLRQAKTSREKLLDYFLPHKMAQWSNTSNFIKRRQELLDQHESLMDLDKAGHHFAILWAAVANTVPASFWAAYYLVSHPEALEAVRQEIHAVLQPGGAAFSADRDVALSREQLDKLLYMESSISESLRLSSASMNIRVAQEDFSMRLDGERSAAVRNGDIIVLYPQSMHLDPSIYEDPTSFRFDRFVEDGKEKTDFYKAGRRLKFYRMPFGSGSTMCPGRHLAVNGIKQFLVVLLLHFEVQLEADEPRVSLDHSRAGLGILLPSNDVRLRYRIRTA